jgi:hypothetical protein
MKENISGTKKIKVSQATIDKIKTMGMTKALSKSATANPEMKEALTRMYGARRVTAAAKANAPANFSTARSTPSTKKGLSKSAAPKKTNNSNTALKVGGAVAAGALLIASRGRAAGLAAKLSPQLAKSGAGKALGMGAKKVSNVKMVAKDKALATSGKVSAKTTKSVTQSQYDAMTAAAKAKGIKPPVKATAKAPAKAPAKISAKKKIGMASVGAGGTGTAKKPTKK